MAEDRVERRLAAILAGDIAGYSRLMSVDEEGTLHDLKVHRKELVDPKITEHRGRIVKTTGDGILVEFVSVVDAVRCAVDIQRGMADRNTNVPIDKRIQFRIGINVGDIIIDGGDIFGDGVNVAARLETLADPGGIMVSSVVHDQVRDKLSFGFEDMGEQVVKNIPRPVNVHRVHLTEVSPEKAKSASGQQKPVSTSSERPSIAVLPFANMSGDPEQEYFADGITEEIITGLSKLRWFFVIARNSSFTYKGKAVDVKRAARELGVRYILEGSVRKGGNRVRITAQLIDAATGNHLWADRYDGELADVFALQDEITKAAVAAIEPKLLEAEALRFAKPFRRGSRCLGNGGPCQLTILADDRSGRRGCDRHARPGHQALSQLRAGIQHVGLHAAGVEPFAGDAGTGVRTKASAGTRSARGGARR